MLSLRLHPGLTDDDTARVVREVRAFADECCHPDRFRVELMRMEGFEIGSLDFPERDALKSAYCFLANRVIRPYAFYGWAG